MKKTKKSLKSSGMPAPRRGIRPGIRFGFAAAAFGLAFVAENVLGQTPDPPPILERQAITGGGVLTGRIMNPDTAGDEDYVIELPGGGSVVLTANTIRKKEILRPETLKYRLTAPPAPDTVESHTEIAAWCDDNALPQGARIHRERILELDPNNETARRALGYEKKDGVWMTPKERREQAGLVMFEGRSVTPQEAVLLEQRREAKKASTLWKKRLKVIQTGLREQDPATKNELWSITAPEALAAVTAALREEPEKPQIRVLYVRAMGNIGTPAALGDLASVALVDNDGEVRLTALEMIKDHPKAVPGAIEYFRQTLRHKENFMINRAGFALGFLDAADAVSDLINALVTTHRQTTVIPGTQTAATFSNKGFVFNPGSNDKVVTGVVNLENADVLAALRSLVQSHEPIPADFGYDTAAWKSWLAERQNLMNFNSRRDF